MAAEDELALPQVPEAEPEDPEDVSWALSTAEAMWARGDHLEGIKWVRKAAEAASDAENDERALALAKAASELTALIARRSRASIGDAPGLAGGAPPVSGVPMSGVPVSHQPMSGVPVSHQPMSHSPASAKPPSVAPTTSRMGNAPPIPPAPAAPVFPNTPAVASGAPPAPAAPAAGAAPAAPIAGTPSRPPPGPIGKPGRSVPPGPIPLPSKASVPPKAPSQAPSQAPPSGRAAPRPLATADARQGPQPGRGILTNRTAPAAPKSPKAGNRRRSRENLDAEARAAGVADTAPLPVLDGRTAETVAVEVPYQDARVRRRSRPEPDPTVVANLDDLAREREKSAEEWDASPTENLSGADMEHINTGDRATAFAIPVAAAAPVAAPARPPMSTVHDPEIQTSQAVRVVVWRDGNGVHVAPAGTVVSSITIDAVLVVLEPSADLTAWLSQR